MCVLPGASNLCMQPSTDLGISRINEKIWRRASMEDQSDLIEMTAGIVSAYVGNNTVTTADLPALIRQVRAKHVTAVFIENMTNPALLERLARDAGAKVQGELFSDSLSPPDGPAATYEAMFRHNVGLLVPAMRGA